MTALLGLLFIRRWHPVWSGIVLAVLVAILGATEYLAFQHLKVWIPAVGAMLTAGLIYGSQGAVAFISERRQRQEIRNAFSMYVSPTVVDEVIAHPERLKLGGERRELTVLFSDLAGFTTIAEGFEPETVAAIVNRHLSEMTEIILQHHGTIDKFIGDGIMAFWGAPIADERQSEQAVQAAVDMQKKMDITSAEIAAETGAVLKMRIGINRGPCIVGNMGGSGRFDYTVMGDTINLASRLEGVNKAYGTRILVSEAVVKAVGEKVRFREVDTVRVKGKHIGIVVYTPCDDEALIALSDPSGSPWSPVRELFADPPERPRGVTKTRRAPEQAISRSSSQVVLLPLAPSSRRRGAPPSSWCAKTCRTAAKCGGSPTSAV